MTIHKMEGYLEWAKVWEGNYDEGNESKNIKPSFVTNFYPVNEETIDDFFATGMAKTMLGHPTLKEGTADLGTGKFFRLKRPLTHASVPEFAGPPKVFDWTEGPASTPWDFETKGELGNGTRVLVKVNLVPQKNIYRLERIAVLEHVAYEGVETLSDEEF